MNVNFGNILYLFTGRWKLTVRDNLWRKIGNFWRLTGHVTESRSTMTRVKVTHATKVNDLCDAKHITSQRPRTLSYSNRRNVSGRWKYKFMLYCNNIFVSKNTVAAVKIPKTKGMRCTNYISLHEIIQTNRML